MQIQIRVMMTIRNNPITVGMKKKIKSKHFLSHAIYKKVRAIILLATNQPALILSANYPASGGFSLRSV